jgi:protein required for attachment to host cells
MEGTIWFVLADADRARILELSEPGARPRLVEELTAPRVVAAPGQHPTDEEMQWFARRIADRLERAYAEARFEFLRIAAAPRFLDRLHAEIDRHPDLHRAELDWLAKDLMALEHEDAIRQMESRR